jgi:hypothetical protein
MNNFSDIITVIGIMVGILTLLFGGLYAFKLFFKFVGRDDKSINFGDNAKVSDSFNKETSFIKKTK